MPTNRHLGLLGAFLIVLAGIVAIGAAFEALDHLIAADVSPLLQGFARALLNPVVAVIVLLLGCVLSVRAWQMPDRGEGGATRERETRTADALEPNMVVFSLHVLPVDRNMQLSGPETGMKAAIIRFRNDVTPKRQPGVMVGTRAMIDVSDSANRIHATGLWTDVQAPVVDFFAGDIHDLIVAFRIRDETSVPEVVPDDLRLWNISGRKAVNMKVQLLGGLERTIARDFQFKLHLEPELRIEKQ